MVVIGTRFPGGADAQSDTSIEHGTPEGYEAGCKGIGCPTGTDETLRFSCSRAWTLSRSDYRYTRMRATGATVAEIAAAFDISSSARDTTPAKKPAPKKTRTRAPKPAASAKETPMPSIAELAPDVADKLTQAAITASADEAATKARTKAEKAAAQRLERKRQSDRVAEVAAKQITPPAEAPVPEPEITDPAAPQDPIEPADPFAGSWALAAPTAVDPVDPLDLADVEAAAAHIVQALSDAFARSGLAGENFRAIVARSLTTLASENAALRARLDRLENETKPARAIAAALAGLTTTENAS